MCFASSWYQLQAPPSDHSDWLREGHMAWLEPMKSNEMFTGSSKKEQLCGQVRGGWGMLLSHQQGNQSNKAQLRQAQQIDPGTPSEPQLLLCQKPIKSLLLSWSELGFLSLATERLLTDWLNYPRFTPLYFYGLQALWRHDPCLISFAIPHSIGQCVLDR